MTTNGFFLTLQFTSLKLSKRETNGRMTDRSAERTSERANEQTNERAIT